MPNVAKEKDTGVSPPSPPCRPEGLVIDLIDDGGKKTSSPAASSDASTLTSSDHSNNDSLAPGWKKYITKRTSQLKKHPNLPREYYFNSITNKYSWFPPRPLLPGEEGSDDTCPTKVVDPNQNGMGRYFRRVPLPTVTPEEELDMDSDPEEETPEEDVEMEEEEEETELSEKEKIQRDVFTGKDLLMRGDGGLIEKAQALGIYNGQKREELEKDIQKYWIDKLKEVCNNPVDEYFLSPIFKQDEQEIMSERKEEYNEKKKREFAEAALEKKGPKKKSKKAPLSAKVALFHYEDRGLYEEKTGDKSYVRCNCNHKRCSSDWGKSEYERHFKTGKHKKYEEERELAAVQQSHLAVFRGEEEQEEQERLANEGTRAQESTRADDAFRERTVKALLQAGVPLNKLNGENGMRRYLEEEAKKSLGSPSHLAAKYVLRLLNGEIELQKSELRLIKYMSIIFDATPRQGDFFALVCRRVVLNAELKRATATQSLIHCSAMKGSLNGESLAREVTAGLAARGKTHDDVIAAMNDGCYTNGAAHDKINEASDMGDTLKTFVSLCISHCASNAGEKATSVTLEYFWKLVQKVVATSDVAKSIWKDITGSAWKNHSATRWYSKYDVMEHIYNRFGDMVPFVTRLVAEGISPANSMKLLVLLTDEMKMHTLRIELCAYVEGLKDLKVLCYFLEGDGTDMPFQVHQRLKEFKESFPDGNMKPLPSVRVCIQEAINWAITPVADGGGGYTAPTPARAQAPVRTVAQITAEVRGRVLADRPRRQRAIQSVRNAVFAGESEAQRNRRHASLLAAQEREATEDATLEALEAAVNDNQPPLTIDDWQAIVISLLAPAIEYFNERMFDETGDRFTAVELFDGASIFNPAIAKGLTRDEAMSKLEKLRHLPALNNEGDDNIVDKLKKGWNAYRQKAVMVHSKFDYKKDHAAILSWHFQQSLHLDDELAEDSRRSKCCRYCGCGDNRCHCNSNLHAYWEAAQLLSLVMPSSGAAERVFSLLNNHFNEHQTRSLSDQIFLSLYLSYNKR